MSNSMIEKTLYDGLTSRDKKLRTSIRTGYTKDLYFNESGIAYLEEEIIPREENKVVLGGILHILKKLFNANATDFDVATLNTIMDIGTTCVPASNSSDLVFGYNVGIEGCGASYADEKEVLDQANIVPGIIPIRVVDSEDELGTGVGNYWLKKQLDSGKYAYYLKKFESNPTVHVLWKDATDPDGDGNPVVGDPSGSSRTDGIESFVQVLINITAQDVREYFELYDNPDYARFNSLGLCVGQKGIDPDTGDEEYIGVTQFSVLNFSNEMLHFDKDLTIIYRIYIS